MTRLPNRPRRELKEFGEEDKALARRLIREGLSYGWVARELGCTRRMARKLCLSMGLRSGLPLTEAIEKELGGGGQKMTEHKPQPTMTDAQRLAELRRQEQVNHRSRRFFQRLRAQTREREGRK